MAKNKLRVDQLMVERGLAESRTLAQRQVMAGQVRVEGEMVHKPSVKVAQDASIEVAEGPRYVSRGGQKLEAALAAFDLDPSGWPCADVGSSTGGFVDCLLQRGAERVYAVDVGHGLLHWRLRNDPRVVLMERTNARELEALPERVKLVTIDVSFISLRLILPNIPRWLVQAGEVVALVKPQFEAGRSEVGKGGLVRDPVVRRKVLRQVMQAALGSDLAPQGLIRSPLVRPKGNVEFLLWLGYAHPERAPTSTEGLLDSVF